MPNIYFTLCGQFLYPERGQKQTFFDPLPPSSCNRGTQYCVTADSTLIYISAIEGVMPIR